MLQYAWSVLYWHCLLYRPRAVSLRTTGLKCVRFVRVIGFSDSLVYFELTSLACTMIQVTINDIS
jgi:hypothetical protein